MNASDPFSEASKLLNMGQLECRRGNYSKGKERITEALQIYEIENMIYKASHLH